ncbi:hypothetical protein F751_1148 [Auxenochlorella protothecoides]|uniref:Coenzyme Q-binding protein COQ10 START domain-containing protein n=1 Tax=Auxenochlorella protothecoides TaxID=3075 RepID=A0A087SMQ8_AUXPR|nr:hypothetical protein F751_1148 [Auxenochlorella protothecoides]KFM27012.1 hypothetical protein F751_1148 [Auxenochlorella protothecoides]
MRGWVEVSLPLGMLAAVCGTGALLNKPSNARPPSMPGEELVWDVLLDFERLPSFLPNLTACQVVARPHVGRLQVLQRGSAHSFLWHLQAQALLDLVLWQDGVGVRKAKFRMVEGDFKDFAGCWSVTATLHRGRPATRLVYEATVVLNWPLPRSIVAYMVKNGLAQNLAAIAARAVQLERGREREDSAASSDVQEDSSSAKPWSFGSAQDSKAWEAAARPSYLGIASVPLPARVPGPVTEGAPQGVQVHLRRLDELSSLHRRVVASVAVHAPRAVIWEALTGYSDLPGIIPSLETSEVCSKRVGYLSLQAQAVMEVLEKEQREIQFRQVEGDLDFFRGKWMVEDDVEEETGVPVCKVTYAAEGKLQHSAAVTQVLEPLLEKVDWLAWWGAEKLEESFRRLAEEVEAAYGKHRMIPPRDVLRADGRSHLEKAISQHGGMAVVLARLGWAAAKRARKPRGYWSNLENVRAEIRAFIIEHHLPEGIMPHKTTFVRCGRHDIARAVERLGGLHHLTTALGYSNPRPAGAGATQWQAHVSKVAAVTKLSGKQGLFHVAACTYDKEPKEDGQDQGESGVS